MKNADVAKALEGYFTLATGDSARPDSEGFIRRWMLLDPISKINNTNRVFTDSYTRNAIMHEYFPGQFTALPKDGDQVKVTMEYQPPVDLTTNRSSVPGGDEQKMVKANLYWHALDSDHFFVKLFRFATGLDKRPACSRFQLRLHVVAKRPGAAAYVQRPSHGRGQRGIKESDAA